MSSAIIQHNPTTSWPPSQTQWNVTVFHKMLIAIGRKSISLSIQDTWVKKDNCKTSQSLWFAWRNAKVVASQSYLTKEFFFSEDTYYLSLESSIESWCYGPHVDTVLHLWT